MSESVSNAVFQQIPVFNAPSIVAGKLLLAFHGAYRHWSIEHYNRCSFRCSYCSPDSQGLSKPALPKESIIETLQHELDAAYKHNTPLSCDEPIGLCRLTDPYAPEEEEYEITRAIIKYLISRGQRFVIATKSVLIRRDIDLFKNYRDKCSIRVSIPFASDEINSQIDCYTPPPSERFKLVDDFNKAGINIMINVGPWIPGLSNVDEVLQKRPKNVFVEIYPLDLGDFMNRQYFLNEAIFIENNAPKAAAENLYDRLKGIAKEGICTSAKNKFSDKWTQDELHKLYIAERNRIGFVKKTAWCYPPGFGDSNSYRELHYLMPHEINL